MNTLQNTALGITLGAIIGMLPSCIVVKQSNQGDGCTEHGVKITDIVKADNKHCDNNETSK